MTMLLLEEADFDDATHWRWRLSQSARCSLPVVLLVLDSIPLLRLGWIRPLR